MCCFFFFFHRFDSLIISSEVGYEKPDPKIFEAALGMSYKTIWSICGCGMRLKISMVES